MALLRFRKLLVSSQLIVFIGLLALFCLPLTWPVSLPPQFWVKQAITCLLYLGIFYLNLRVIVPNLLFKEKVGQFAGVVFIVLVVMVELSHLLDKWLNLPALMAKIASAKHADTAYQHVPIAEFGLIIVLLIIFGVSTITAVAQKVQRDSFREQNLEKEKVSAELAFLKTQINPHFFFNVLHTIYALIETDTGRAKDSVYTLSHMMRYVLYETRNDTTTLTKEVAFVEDYLKLMQLRLTGNVQVIFDKPQNLKDVPVAPMLFLPFIENAFKHGISSVHPSYIYTGIQQDGDTLQIEVRNAIFDEKAEHLEESNGIGLMNTRRRLNLVYPDRHELQVKQDDKAAEFTVKLKLNLK